MASEFNELLSSVSLSPTLNTIAEYIMDHQEECCFFTATQIAGACSVSFSSVIRFSRVLGFAGFQEFQSYLQSMFRSRPEADMIDEAIVVPSERLKEIRKKGRTLPVKDLVTTHVLANLQKTIASNTEEQYRHAIQILMDSGIRYIVSSRGSNSIAEYLNVMMRQMIPHVYNYGNHGQNIFDFVSDLTEKDCMIAITFPRYSELTALAVEMARKQGAKIILITNKPTAPMAHNADVVLTAACESSDFYNSYVAAMYVAEMLCATLSRMTGYSNEDLLQRINEYTSKVGNY